MKMNANREIKIKTSIGSATLRRDLETALSMDVKGVHFTDEDLEKIATNYARLRFEQCMVARFNDDPESFKREVIEPLCCSLTPKQFEKDLPLIAEKIGYEVENVLLPDNESLVKMLNRQIRIWKETREINSVVFGNYPQANGTVNPIEWEVLKQDGNKALLVSKNGLTQRRFDEDSNVWADSEIRHWLNNEFLNAAFTEADKTAILETELPDVGTTDKVFLLSYKEAKMLFNDNKARRVKFGTRYYLWWWLRSPFQSYAAVVGTDGSLSYNDVGCDSNVVRPALWVDLDSEIFKS